MLFKLMKNREKIVVYEFNINSFELIFHKWKIVLSNLTLGISNYFLFTISSPYIHIWVISPIIDKRLYLTLFDLATTL